MFMYTSLFQLHLAHVYGEHYNIDSVNTNSTLCTIHSFFKITQSIFSLFLAYPRPSTIAITTNDGTKAEPGVREYGVPPVLVRGACRRCAVGTEWVEPEARV